MKVRITYLNIAFEDMIFMLKDSFKFQERIFAYRLNCNQIITYYKMRQKNWQPCLDILRGVHFLGTVRAVQ